MRKNSKENTKEQEIPYSYLIDNIKILLIFLVVFNHIIAFQLVKEDEVVPLHLDTESPYPHAGFYFCFRISFQEAAGRIKEREEPADSLYSGLHAHMGVTDLAGKPHGFRAAQTIPEPLCGMCWRCLPTASPLRHLAESVLLCLSALFLHCGQEPGRVQYLFISSPES